MTQTTIIIADDQPLIRDGLEAILNMEEGYTVVATTGDGLATLEKVRLFRPRLVLMDIHMPVLDGLQATKQIKLEHPDTMILILTTFEDEEYMLEAIRHGASGFLIKGVETDKMLSTIRDCLDGRINYPFRIQLRLVQELAASKQHGEQQAEKMSAAAASSMRHDERLDCLTKQERNVLMNLKLGKSNQTIAADLFVTTGTVKNYLNAIYRKLNLSSRSEAIAFLREHDL